MTTRKPTKCQACGHRGGTLAPRHSEAFDRITTATGTPREAALWVCDGDLFAVDGATECLRRLVAKAAR